MRKVIIAAAVLLFCTAGFAEVSFEEFIVTFKDAVTMDTDLISDYKNETRYGYVVQLSDDMQDQTRLEIGTKQGMSDFVKRLAREGWICEVFGHQWKHPIGYSSGDVYYPNSENPRKRTCNICDKVQVFEISHSEQWVDIE
jgi:hypothetical protein